jgi:hypothetical protein
VRSEQGLAPSSPSSCQGSASASLFHHSRDIGLERGDIEGLYEERHLLELSGRFSYVLVRMPGDKSDGQLGIDAADGVNQLKSAHVSQLIIHKQDARPEEDLALLKGSHARAKGMHCVVARAEPLAQALQQVGIVLDYDDRSLVLTEVEADIRRVGLSSLAADQGYWQALRRTLERTPQLSSLIVIDAEGKVQLSSVVFPPPTEVNVSDRGYFQASRAGAYRYIGEPLIGRSSGRRLIPISLRLGGPEGQFQGVILATLDLAYFESFYTSVRDKLDLRIGMFRRDGSLLSLYPLPPGELPAYAKDAVAKELATHRARTWINDSPLDGVKKISAYRNLERYPVAVTVAHDYQAFLAQLHPALLRDAIVFVVFVAGIAISILIISRQMRLADKARDRQLELAREQQETQRLCRAIARNLPNGRVAVFDTEMRHLFLDGKGVGGSEKLLGRRSGRSTRPRSARRSSPWPGALWRAISRSWK